MLINYRIGNITLHQSAITVASTNTTSEELLTSILIPAGVMRANAMMRIIVLFSGSGSGTKTSRLRLATTQGTSGTAILGVNLSGTSTLYERSVHLWNANAVNSQKSYSLTSSSGVGVISGSPVLTSVDFSVNQFLNITSQKATGTEAHALEAITVQIIEQT